MRLAVFCCGLSVLALTSCDSGGVTVRSAESATTATDATGETTDVTPSVPDEPSGAGFSVKELGLTFSLADSFEQEADGDYAFSARSMSPRSFFTIYSEPPSITDYSQRPGETVHRIDLGQGVTAVEVLDAAIKDLPSGISANELLVSNGDRSFSVIMSSVAADLDELWSVFVASVKAEPSG